MSGIRILGIDPGLRLTGFGVIEQTGQELAYIASGVIKSGEGSLPRRLGVLFAGLNEVIATYRPDACAVAEITMRPETGTELAGDDAVKMQKILDALERLDDVQAVYTNAVLPE